MKMLKKILLAIKNLNKTLKTAEIKIKEFFAKHEYFKVYLIILALSFACFAIIVIPNGFTLTMNGDYILQQYHFYYEGYDTFWNWVATGEFKLWSYEGFLGYNYFAANTFYYVTSPFMLPLCFVPRSFIPQMIFIMMINKMALGGLFFYILLKKYLKMKPEIALIGAVTYALSGWGMYYLWFHFHDVLAVFPLTLIGVEHILQKRKGWLLALSLFIMGITNYFFLFAFAVSTILYGIFRYFQLFKENRKHNLELLGKAIFFVFLGIAMSAFVLYPSYLIIQQSSRFTGNNSNLLLNLFELFFIDPSKNTDGGYTLGNLKALTEIFSWDNIKTMFDYFFIYDATGSYPTLQRILYPITQLLFPTVNCWDSLLFDNDYFDNAISSTFISLPLTMLLWPAFFKMCKNKNIWGIIGFVVCLILPLVPLSSYIFHAFSQLYGRWHLFLVALLIIFTVPLIDKYDDIPKHHLDISFFIHFSLALVAVIYSYENNIVEDTRRYFGIAGVLVYMCIVYFLMRTKVKKGNAPATFFPWIAMELILVGNITAQGHGVSNYWTLNGGPALLAEQQEIVDAIEEEDPSFYRIFNSVASRNAPNLACTLGYRGLGSFNSVYNYNLDEFINEWSRISYTWYNWSMGVDEKRYNLDTFLNVKYYILGKDDTNIPGGFSAWDKNDQFEHYNVWINDYHVELGYAFDDMMSFSTANNVSYYNKEIYYNTNAIVPDDTMAILQTELGDDINTVTSVTNGYSKQNVNNRNDVAIKVKLRHDDNANDEYVEVNSVSSIAEILPTSRSGYLHRPWESRNYEGDIIRFEFDNPLAPLATTENKANVVLSLCYGPSSNVTFYNQSGQVITSDDHGANNYGHNNDTKYARGFYIDEPAYSCEIEILNDTLLTLFNKFTITFNYEYFETYAIRQNALLEDAFDTVNCTDNSIHFTTSYDKKKLIVLSVPYDDGWTLKVNGQVEDIYVLNAGFIGIVAPQGDAEYTLEYLTPGLDLGGKVSAVAIAIFLVVTLTPLLYGFIKDKKKVLKIVKDK